jgi:N utilization substance protein B
MGIRRKAREASLQLLYEIDLSQKPFEELFQESRRSVSLPIAGQEEPAEGQAELRDFTQQLVTGVARNMREIDRLIESHSIHWKISRMALVDRNILRMAVFELLYCPEIPSSVTINEAIEIAKRFGTEESGAFINGILDHIAKELKKV